MYGSRNPRVVASACQQCYYVEGMAWASERQRIMIGLDSIEQDRGDGTPDQGSHEAVVNTEILVFIFILGLLGLNWPILEIFRTEAVPYLFVFWFLFIVVVAFASSKNKRQAGRSRNN